MKHFFALGMVALMMLVGVDTHAAADNYDVFIPIAKYIRQGDAEKLSAWFNQNLEITILNKTNTCSRNQAKQIVKSFFESYNPREFVITHTAGQGYKKYAIGDLDAGGEMFEVTIFINLRQKNNYQIEMFKIDKKSY